MPIAFVLEDDFTTVLDCDIMLILTCHLLEHTVLRVDEHSSRESVYIKIIPLLKLIEFGATESVALYLYVFQFVP